MHVDYNQFMHPIISFNTLCIPQGSLSTFSMESVAFSTIVAFGFAQQKPLQRRVWFLRNNNRYNGAFGFAQQKPLQRRVLFCATITVTTARLVFAQQ